MFEVPYLIAGVPEVLTNDGLPLLQVEDKNVVYEGVHFSSPLFVRKLLLFGGRIVLAYLLGTCIVCNMYFLQAVIISSRFLSVNRVTIDAKCY